RIQPADLEARFSVQGVKASTHQNFSVCLQRQAIHITIRAGTKKIVRGTVREEPADVAPGLATKGGELTADQDPAVGLHGQSIHATVGPHGARIEVGVQTAVNVQPGQVGAGDSGDGGEEAANDNSAVGLERHRMDPSVDI